MSRQDGRITVYLLSPTARRPFFTLEWVDPDTGLRRSKSSRTSDEDRAEQARADLEYELNHGSHHQPSKLTWEQFRELYEREYTAGLRPTTRRFVGEVFNTFEDICHPDKLAGITERTLSRFVSGARQRELRAGKVGMEPVTVKNYLIALKTALGWAVKQKFLARLPEVPTVKVPKKKPSPVYESEFQKLYDQAPTDAWRAYLLCGWYGGLRLNEAYCLRWEPSGLKPWVDLAGDRIVLPAPFVKADEDQWVPLHPKLREALEKLPREGEQVFAFRSQRGGNLTLTGVSSRIILLARRAGVKLSMHRLRKGFGCRVAQKLGKGNAPILHRLMRHSSMQVTMDYYASVDEVLHDKIREL